MKNIALYITLLLIAALSMFTGCSSDGDGPDAAPERVPHTLSMSISTRSYQPTAATELINSWWIAFVAPDGTVAEVIDRETVLGTDGKLLPKTAVERETFKVTLLDGVYRVYAFANFTGSSPSANIWGIEKGKPMPDLSNVTWATPVNAGDYVPMTGFTTIRVPAQDSQNLMVEVVRLFAKLQFDFARTTQRGKSVKRIKMLNANTSKINLLPDYTKLDGLAPVLPADALNNALEYDVDITLSNAETISFWSYVFESTAASHPTGHYVLEFDVQNDDATTKTYTALAYQLDHITRNDYVVIPVTFTDWALALEVRFYPPIGGYPAVMVDSKGDEFYAEFGTSGYFEIQPHVTDSFTGEELPVDKFEVALTTESGADLFSLQPAWERREIVGELAEGRAGTAILNLDITVTEDALKQIFKRKLYIIRN